MNLKPFSTVIALVAILTASTVAPGTAQVVFNPDNGHYYTTW